MTAETCTVCTEPATLDVYAGWWLISGEWTMQTRPMCDWHAAEDARARAEAMAS